MRYRPEIDGIRTIAVFAVIFYHADFLLLGVNPFRGGYIGVDLFFVISGYLITSIILREENSGGFSFLNFYERRARRILPALFTIMLVSIPFAWYYLMPKAVMEYAGSLLSTLAFSSNFWFWLEDSYWAEPSTLKPLLHTWSLAVEEQFYIFFPIILLLTRRFHAQYMLISFIILFLLSFLFAGFASYRYPDANFFLIQSRAWELLAGAILAKIEIEKGRINNTILSSVLCPIGLCLIIYSIIFFQDEIHHPSFMTFLPILGTMILIWFCKEREFVTLILSSRIFVAFGLISYSLYLWHQPIFAFSRIANFQQTNTNKLILIILTILFSFISYFIVEKPFRNKRIISRKKLIYILCPLSIVIALPAIYAYLHGGEWGRFEKWQLRFLAEDRTVTGQFAEYVRSDYSKNSNKFFDIDKKRKRLLVIGDSFSQDFFNILKENDFLINIDVSTHYIGNICKNVPASVYIKNYGATTDERCASAIRIGDERLDERLKQADIVVVASRWTPDTLATLPSLYSEVKQRSNAEVFIIGIKQIPTIDSESLANMTLLNLLNMKSIPESNILDIQIKCRNLFHNNADYVDLGAIICGNEYNSCPLSTPNGYLVSYDGFHLTQEGAKYVGGLLKENEMFMKKWNRAIDL